MPFGGVCVLYTNVDCCWRQNTKKHRHNADAFLCMELSDFISL